MLREALQALRRDQDEEHVRKASAWHRAIDLPDRSRRQARPRVARSQSPRPRRRCSGGRTSALTASYSVGAKSPCGSTPCFLSATSSSIWSSHEHKHLCFRRLVVYDGRDVCRRLASLPRLSVRRLMVERNLRLAPHVAK